MKLTSTSEHLTNNGLKVLVYGNSGAGKTTLASTLIQHGPCIILSMESGLKSISHFNIPVIDITKDDNGQPLKTADAKYKKFLDALTWLGQPAQKANYKTVFIDSLTELASIIFTKGKDINEASSKPDNFKLWGDYVAHLSKLLRALRDSDHYNIVFSALESTDEDDLKRKFSQPAVDGKRAQEALLPIFDEVWRLMVDEKGQRHLITKPRPTFAAKSRSNCLDEAEPANLDFVFNKINPPKPKDTIDTSTNVGVNNVTKPALSVVPNTVPTIKTEIKK